MKCPRCQAENREGARFCRECGATFGAVCSTCGTKIEAGSKFCDGCGASLAVTPSPGLASSRFASAEAYTPKHLAEKILTSKSALEGERKQVTVLFADLKGSMELLADRDPEEARKILDPVLERMMEAVHRYEGTVNQVMGDGIMALFGAPLAHEDHAVRACYAALRMQEAVRSHAEDVQRHLGVALQIRVGLNSGEVVVRSIGSDLHMDYTAVGQTTHLAARMEQMAMPGSILMTAESLRLAEGFVEVKPLGPASVKGLNNPVQVYEVVGAGTVRSRLQASAARGLTRFVGRSAELDQLGHALERAAAGHGQVVGVVGEAGVGKSRLFWEFVHSLRTRDCLVVESASVSYGKATAYLPVIELLRVYFQVGDRDDARKIRDKVTGKIVALDEDLLPAVPALLALLDMPPDDREWQSLDPPQRRMRTLDALKRLLLRESHVQPLVLVFEDLHWIDSETQAFLDGLVETLPTARILVLVNYRPEYSHGWGGKSYYTPLRVDPLPAERAEELLQTLFSDDPALRPPTRLLIERTEGNPFFLEECVRTLVETRVLAGERGAYRLARGLDAIQVPATAQAILAARIDRLGPENKRLLQTAAVIGKDVPLALLKVVADEPEETTLRDGLARLQAAEFLYEARLFPDLEYTFKHALTHEVAYGSLLQDRRRTLHARIVDAIETLAADRRAEQTERLAHHAFRGGQWEKAVTYLRQAAVRSMSRAAYREAAGHLEQALEGVRHLPERRETAELAIDLRFELRTSLFPLAETDRMLGHLREAEALAAGLGDQRRLGRVSNYMVIQSLFAGAYDEAVRFGQRALALARTLAAVPMEAVANAYLGVAHVNKGEFAQAISPLQRNIDLLTGDLLYERFGQAVIMSSLSRWMLALVLSERGEFAEAIVHAQEAARIAKDAGHRYTLAGTWEYLGLIEAARGNFDGAIAVLDRSLELSRASQFMLRIPGTVASLGYALSSAGRVGDARPLVEEAARTLSSQRSVVLAEREYVRLGTTYLIVGRPDEAMRWARKAFDACRCNGACGTEATVLHLLGQIAARGRPPDAEETESRHRAALSLAEQLGMRPLVADCHLALGKLYRRTGKREQAQEHLTTATTMYREMGMTYWLEKAEAELKD
jgi:class 3 adenylate cyclase/tetratricopeptide (TPR) repeat protein